MKKLVLIATALGLVAQLPAPYLLPENTASLRITSSISHTRKGPKELSETVTFLDGKGQALGSLSYSGTCIYPKPGVTAATTVYYVPTTEGLIANQEIVFTDKETAAFTKLLSSAQKASKLSSSAISGLKKFTEFVKAFAKDGKTILVKLAFAAPEQPVFIRFEKADESTFANGKETRRTVTRVTVFGQTPEIPKHILNLIVTKNGWGIGKILGITTLGLVGVVGAVAAEEYATDHYLGGKALRYLYHNQHLNNARNLKKLFPSLRHLDMDLDQNARYDISNNACIAFILQHELQNEIFEVLDCRLAPIIDTTCLLDLERSYFNQPNFSAFKQADRELGEPYLIVEAPLVSTEEALSFLEETAEDQKPDTKYAFYSQKKSFKAFQRNRYNAAANLPPSAPLIAAINRLTQGQHSLAQDRNLKYRLLIARSEDIAIINRYGHDLQYNNVYVALLNTEPQSHVELHNLLRDNLAQRVRVFEVPEAKTTRKLLQEITSWFLDAWQEPAVINDDSDHDDSDLD